MLVFEFYFFGVFSEAISFSPLSSRCNKGGVVLRALLGLGCGIGAFGDESFQSRRSLFYTGLWAPPPALMLLLYLIFVLSLVVLGLWENIY